jgi:hypothetical protein
VKSIRWNRKRKCFLLSDGTPSNRWREFAIDSALDVSLSSLRRALARQDDISVPSLSSLPSPESYRNYSDFRESILEGPNAEIAFVSRDNTNVLFFVLTPQGHIRAHFQVENPRITDKSMVVEITHRIFGKLCDTVQHLQYAKDGDGRPFWSFEIVCDPTSQTVAGVWQAYMALCFTLRTSPEDLTKSVEGVQLALQLGRPDVLIGALESSWLEVKSDDYRRLSSGVEKIKLALDVARFANADGGLLVLGMSTSKSIDVEIISRVTPFPMPARSVSRYRSVIDAHIYPLVRGLHVFSVPYDTGELLAIRIPPQPEDYRPFVVHGNLGSITNNRVKGQFVSIVQRRGDGAEYLGGPAIYGLLATRRFHLDQ